MPVYFIWLPLGSSHMHSPCLEKGLGMQGLSTATLGPGRGKEASVGKEVPAP